MKRVDVAYALVFDEVEQKVLMVKNRGRDWSLPGGAVEKGETFAQAAIRECKEETNVTIEVETIVAVNEAFFEKEAHHALFLTFKAKVVDGSIRVVHKDEIEEIKWVDYETADGWMPYHANGVERLLQASAPYTFQG